jgi:hypothetical protein
VGTLRVLTGQQSDRGSAFGILASAFFWLAFVFPCAAQSSSILGGAPLDALTYGRQTDAFRRLLFEFHFQPVPSFAELVEDPNQSLFIMLGDPQCLIKRNFPEGLRSFVEQGGAVLIATDKRTFGEAKVNLSELAGVTVTGETLVIRRPPQPGGSITRYDNSAYCPFVEPIEDWASVARSTSVLGTMASFLGSGGRPDLFRRGPQPDQPQLRVATNAPSRLQVTEWGLPGGIHRLAQLPASCEKEKITPHVNRNGLIRQSSGEEDSPPIFAVGGTVGKGRVLVLADHSIFINRMMLPLARDNGNLEFAANCLHWMRGGVSSPAEALKAVNSQDALKQLTGHRKHVLFWDDGKVQTNFEVLLKKTPLPPTLASEPAIVAAIDKTIAKLEDEDYFNRELFANMKEWPGGLPRVRQSVVYLLTLAAFLLLAYRFLWRVRHRHESAVPLLADAVSQHEPRGSLLDQRRRELLRVGNVWEMGHRLAREFFESAGVTLTAAPPRVVMPHGNWRQRWHVRRQVARLWRLACSDTPVSLAPAALRHRLRELEELKSALANGTIKLMISAR